MKILVLLSILTYSFCSLCYANAFIYSQNKKNLEEITENSLIQILKGNKSYWENGERIKLCHIDVRNNEFQNILESYLNLTSDQYLNLWRRKLFTGRGFPPSLLKSKDEVIDCVHTDDQSIGILSKKIKLQKNLHLKEIKF